MTKIYKTSKGKSIDMDKLRLANEETIAVGNMKVNARGDELGSGGKVVAGKNQKADAAYVAPPYVPTPFVASAPAEAPVTQNNAQKLNNIIENLTNPGQAPAPATAPVGRGTLADSVAKTTAVNQELLKPLNKKSGPSRI
jgi:hypothetical protein